MLYPIVMTPSVLIILKEYNVHLAPIMNMWILRIAATNLRKPPETPSRHLLDSFAGGRFRGLHPLHYLLSTEHHYRYLLTP